jgi:hypothetical protein
MGVRAVRLLAAMTVLGCWHGSAAAQETEPAKDMTRVFERLQQRDREAREDGFVLESFKVEQPPNDPRRKSMKLSVGEVGDEPDGSPFDEKGSNYLLDPLTPYEPPPVGLNLKLQF